MAPRSSFSLFSPVLIPPPFSPLAWQVNPQSGVVCEALPGKQGAVLVRCALEVNRDVYFEHLAEVMSMDDEYSDDDEEEEEE